MSASVIIISVAYFMCVVFYLGTTTNATVYEGQAACSQIDDGQQGIWCSMYLGVGVINIV